MDKQKILLVDDERDILELFGEALEQEGYSIATAGNGNEGIEKFKGDIFDIVLSDLNMPGMSGLGFLKEIKRLNSRVPFIIITAYGSVETTVKALKDGAFDYITKPVNMEEIVPILKKAVRLKKESSYTEVLAQHIENRFKVCILNKIEFIEPVISQIEGISRIVGYNGGRFDVNLKNAIYEAVLNAIIHGNRMDKNKRVDIDANITCKRLETDIADEGSGFDPSPYLGAVINGNLSKLKGRGIFLIRGVMDNVRYNSKGNVITMEKYA
ncbi:MAG: response regulator [Nitrospinae bacterium]|nr:response regulator [Nitrospinota bacterium]